LKLLDRAERDGMTSWFNLAHSAAMLGMESHSVIGLRVMRLALGGASARTEAERMVSEKMQALAEAHLQIATDVLTGRGHVAIERTVSSYRKIVRANQRRLMVR
jgi:hypothetical protein